MEQKKMSHVQNSIQEWIDDLIPIKTTLNDEIISKLDTHIVEACKKLHAFITRLYKDMYENPDKYGLNNNSEEITDRGLNVLYGFIWEGIPDGELINDTLVFIPDFNKKINHHKGINKLFNKTSYSMRERLNFLRRCGLLIEEKDGGAYVTNPEYPNIFLPLQKMRQASFKNYAGSVVYRNCEFRLIADQKYSPTLSDIMYNRTSQEMKNLLYKIDKYAEQNKFKTECRVKECIYYKYKGKRIFNIRVRRHEVHVEVGIGNLDHINQMFESYSDEFKNFITKNMNYCRNCFSEHGGGNKVILFNKQIRICSGGPFLYIKNPLLCQFENIIKAIDFGCSLVDNEKKSKNK